MRIVYTSTDSTLADDAGRVAYDYFELTIVESCYQLSLSFTAGIDDIDYRVHSAAAAETYTPTKSISDSSCTVTYTVYTKE